MPLIRDIPSRRDFKKTPYRPWDLFGDNNKEPSQIESKRKDEPQHISNKDKKEPSQIESKSKKKPQHTSNKDKKNLPISNQQLIILSYLLEKQIKSGLGYTPRINSSTLSESLEIPVKGLRKQINRLIANKFLIRVNSRRGRGDAGSVFQIPKDIQLHLKDHCKSNRDKQARQIETNQIETNKLAK